MREFWIYAQVYIRVCNGVTKKIALQLFDKFLVFEIQFPSLLFILIPPVAAARFTIHGLK